jgi:HEAT repeat protein
VQNQAIDEMFAATLSGDYDSDAPWEAVRELHKLGSHEIFDQAAAWCNSHEPLRRARGADVLAQIGTTEHRSDTFRDKSFAVISSMLGRETELLPLLAAIHALGHIRDPRAVSLVVQFRSHEAEDVRFAVACTLGNFANDPVAVAVLIQLTNDADPDVRDWATFGIGSQSELDSAELREALVRNLDDSFDNVRQEAIVGLANRTDLRVLAALLSGLESPGAPSIIIEAAGTMLEYSNEATDCAPSELALRLREKFAL